MTIHFYKTNTYLALFTVNCLLYNNDYLILHLNFDYARNMICTIYEPQSIYIFVYFVLLHDVQFQGICSAQVQGSNIN